MCACLPCVLVCLEVHTQDATWDDCVTSKPDVDFELALLHFLFQVVEGVISNQCSASLRQSYERCGLGVSDPNENNNVRRLFFPCLRTLGAGQRHLQQQLSVS